MIIHKLKAIGQMVDGDCLSAKHDELFIHGVSIDSRTIKPGNLFIPIIRELDGHDYVEEAIAKGASASLWQKDHPNPPIHLPLIYVEDCLHALQNLAAHYRNELSITIIGVTGSNGKTTTKEMLNKVLQTKYRVHKTEGNLNSQIGVPLTILGMDKRSEMAIIEMGMSERGQIEKLSRIVRPDIAVITMIGLSHLASLGSKEEIAAAKLEIVSGLQEGGCLVYNGDEPLLVEGIKNIHNNNTLNLVSFGEGKSNHFTLRNAVTHSKGSVFEVGENKFSISILGAYNMTNALAAITAAAQLGISPAEMNKGLQSVEWPAMRMETIKSPLGHTVINDAWNASPVSMRAAITTFYELTGYRQKYLVLGDMLELGEQGVEFHQEIGRGLDLHKIHHLYTVGELSKHIAIEAKKQYPHGNVRIFLDKWELAAELASVIKNDDVILVKGSRGTNLDLILPILLNESNNRIRS